MIILMRVQLDHDFTLFRAFLLMFICYHGNMLLAILELGNSKPDMQQT